MKLGGRATIWSLKPNPDFVEKAKSACKKACLTVIGVSSESRVETQSGLKYTMDILNALSNRHVGVIVTHKGTIDHPDLPYLSDQLAKKGISVISLSEVEAYAESLSGEPVKVVKVPVAKRLLQGRYDNAAKGMFQSGPVPYGYCRPVGRKKGAAHEIVPHEVEAPVVRLIFKIYGRLRSMKKVCLYLSERGIKTRRRKEWSRAGLSWLLENPVYVGRIRFAGLEFRGIHRPIVSPIVYNKAQKTRRLQLKRPLRKKTDA